MATKQCNAHAGFIKYKLKIPRSSIIGLQMKPEEIFSSTGHFPLHISTSETGKTQYATQLYGHPENVYYGITEDGASEIQYWDGAGALIRRNQMHHTVLAWRWDPDPLEQDYDSALEWELCDEVSRAVGDRYAEAEQTEGAHLVDIENELDDQSVDEI